MKHANNSKMLEENVAEYADPRFDAGQMREILIGLFDGLSKEKVASYADPSLSAKEMRDRRSHLH